MAADGAEERGKAMAAGGEEVRGEAREGARGRGGEEGGGRGAGAARGEEEAAGIGETTPSQQTSAGGNENGKQEVEGGDGEKINKFKKRKVVVYTGYYGARYQGMQRNPGAYTIEDVLENAMHKAGGISSDNFGDLGKISWARAARTDKGVSALCNVVSLKMVLEPEGIVERINAELPQDVRVFGYVRVTNSFDARKMCDRRRYGYVLPIWAIDPDHALDGGKNDSAELDAASCEAGEVDGANAMQPTKRNASELAARFEQVLRMFEGTHNFHSYSKHVNANQPEASRYIIRWKAEAFECNGKEYVKCEVLGQSFLYHQIRKMVGMALAVVRGTATEACLRIALKSRKKFNVPLAPASPLYLEECIFHSYNTRWGHDHDAVKRDAFMKQIDQFKSDVLHANIIGSNEYEEEVYAWWRGVTEELHHFSRWGREATEYDKAHPVPATAKRKHLNDKQQSRGGGKWAHNNKKSKQGQGEKGAEKEQTQTEDANGSSVPTEVKTGPA